MNVATEILRVEVTNAFKIDGVWGPFTWGKNWKNPLRTSFLKCTFLINFSLLWLGYHRDVYFHNGSLYNHDHIKRPANQLEVFYFDLNPPNHEDKAIHIGDSFDSNFEQLFRGIRLLKHRWKAFDYQKSFFFWGEYQNIPKFPKKVSLIFSSEFS